MKDYKNVFEGLKLSKEESSLIRGGEEPIGGGGSGGGEAWICFSASCNEGCNTECATCFFCNTCSDCTARRGS